MIRREPTYLTTETWKACHLLAQAKGKVTDDHGLTRTMTADEVANELLEKVIADQYPQIGAHRNQVKKIEREFVKTLGGAKT